MSKRLRVYVEGATEEFFVNRILKNHLAQSGVIVERPILAATSIPSGQRGGFVNWAAVEADLRIWTEREPFASAVRHLAAYRGVTSLGALTLQAEVCDWRRFGRAASFMGFVGLVPREYSSGGSTHRGHITKAGNAHLRAQLVEAAWSYQHRPYVGPEIAKRHEGLAPEVVARAWATQMRLCGRFRHLAARKNTKSVVAAAIARELAGFLWAEMVA